MDLNINKYIHIISQEQKPFRVLSNFRSTKRAFCTLYVKPKSLKLLYIGGLCIFKIKLLEIKAV